MAEPYLWGRYSVPFIKETEGGLPMQVDPVNAWFLRFATWCYVAAAAACIPFVLKKLGYL